MKWSTLETSLEKAVRSWGKNELQISVNTFKKLNDTSMWKFCELIMLLKKSWTHPFHLYWKSCHSLALFSLARHWGPNCGETDLVTFILLVTDQSLDAIMHVSLIWYFNKIVFSFSSLINVSSESKLMKMNEQVLSFRGIQHV